MKLRNGLEYEIACSSFRGKKLLHQSEVIDDDDGNGNIFFVYHTGFTGISQKESPGYRLLEYRVNNIANHIKDSPYYAQGDYEKTLIDAFERLDEELEELVKEIGWDGIPLSAEYLWRTRYNTLVVLLHKKKELYVAGASHLHVLVIRGGENVIFTSENHIDQSIILRRSQFAGPNPIESAALNEYGRYLWMKDISVEEHPQLFYYNRVALKGTEEYLVAACDNIPEDIKYVLSGGLPRRLPEFDRERGLKFAADYMHSFSCDATEAVFFVLQLKNRKRKHEECASDISSDVSTEGEVSST